MEPSIKLTPPLSKDLRECQISSEEAREFILKHNLFYMFKDDILNLEPLSKAERWGFFEEKNLVGMVLLEKLPHTFEHMPSYQIHIAFDKGVRGNKSLKLARRWLKNYNKDYGKIVGFTPLKWRHACFFARALKPARIFKTTNYLVTEFRNE